MPTIRHDQKAKRYVLDARDIGGGEHRYKTEELAKAAERKMVHDDVDGVFINASTAVVFETCIREWLRTNKERVALGDIGGGEYDNMKTSARHIREFTYMGQPIGEVKVNELRSGPLTKMVLPQIRAGRAHATAKKLLIHFKAVFKDAVLSEYLAYDPARELKLPKRDGENDVEDIAKLVAGEKSLAEKLATENIIKIIEAAESTYQRQIMMIAYTGARVGELIGAQWDQIEFGEDEYSGVFNIYRAKKKKGEIAAPKTASGVRSIPLTPELRKMLMEWKIEQPLKQREQNFVFPSREGNRADGDNWLKRGMYPACDAAGVDCVSLRDLRHYFASILIFDKGFTEATVTELMGHRDISFTKRQYATWLKNAKRDKSISRKLSMAFEA